MPAKTLYRSRENAMIGGVCAGLAEYFNIDISLVRLATVILIFPGGLSIWAYIIAWIIVPQKPLAAAAAQDMQPGQNQGAGLEQGDIAAPAESTDKAKFIIGGILIAMGVLFLLNTFNVFVWFSFFKLWPVVLIVIGLVVLLKGLGRSGGDEN
jgi:phage shock protein C